jgi:hypothetical protein
VDPEHIEAMREAFQRVCDIRQLDCGREDPMTELVMKIVEIAKAGERDPECLCLDVLAELRKSGRPQPRGSMGLGPHVGSHHLQRALKKGDPAR